MHISTPESDHDIDPVCLSIANKLATTGWCVQADFLDASYIDDLRQQTSITWRHGEFQYAGVGRGQELTVRPALRNDRIRWLDPADCHPVFTRYFERMETLRTSINRLLYLGLFDYEAHLAIYPPGSFYRKHLDQFRGIGLRTLTTTLYLNPDWQDAEGGQLRLYLGPESTQTFVDIAPAAGTLVCFLSADFLHEVLPAERERLSITGWFRQRAG